MLGAALLLLSASAGTAAKKPIVWETGHVVSQDVSSETVGAHATPNFGVGTPRTVVDSTPASKVVVDVGDLRYTWTERFVAKPIILLVNTDVQFYRDKEWFVVLDAKGKLHRFALSGMEKLPQKN